MVYERLNRDNSIVFPSRFNAATEATTMETLRLLI